MTTKSARRFEEEISTHNECDQDSRFSFDDDEENTTSHEDNLEDWIEVVKRSTKEADENMLTQRRARASRHHLGALLSFLFSDGVWVDSFSSHTKKGKKWKLKWRHALRHPTQSKERWTRKAAEWNPGLDKSSNTQRRAGRPAKRWEDDLNDFVKAEATETAQSNDLKNDTTWF